MFPRPMARAGCRPQNRSRRFSPIYHYVNLDKVRIPRTDIAAAIGAIVISHDEALEHGPAACPRLVRLIGDGRADVLFRIAIHGRRTAPGSLCLSPRRRRHADNRAGNEQSARHRVERRTGRNSAGSSHHQPEAISDLGDTTHGGLGGHAEPGAQRGVSSLVQIKLASPLGVRCQAGQPVAARVTPLQVVVQQSGLLWRRQQPDRGDELHRSDALAELRSAANNRFGDCSVAASVVAAAAERR
jgi:hypothetical protein